jgi:hypothetical protein
LAGAVPGGPPPGQPARGQPAPGQPAPGQPAPAGPAPAAGHGLVGMRERVAVHGGTLHAGPCEQRGWAVRASIPLPRVTPPAVAGVLAPVAVQIERAPA